MADFLFFIILFIFHLVSISETKKLFRKFFFDYEILAYAKEIKIIYGPVKAAKRKHLYKFTPNKWKIICYNFLEKEGKISKSGTYL